MAHGGFPGRAGGLRHSLLRVSSGGGAGHLLGGRLRLRHRRARGQDLRLPSEPGLSQRRHARQRHEDKGRGLGQLGIQWYVFGGESEW